jgi:23S rRNA pseudouridine2605 synthase
MYRINQAISRMGIATRREADRLIKDGFVTLNSNLVTDFSTLVRIGDIIIINKKSYKFAPPPLAVYMFNKPVGCITGRSDPNGRPTVFDVIPQKYNKLISIGRLDYNTQGLLLFTNDGEFARFMEIPSSDMKRVYSVRAHGFLNPEKYDKIVSKAREGLVIDGVKYGKVLIRFENAEKIIATDRRTAKNHNLQVTVFEGKNNEVRKIMANFGLTVNRLTRRKFGDFFIGGLEGGKMVKAEIPVTTMNEFKKYLETNN